MPHFFYLARCRDGSLYAGTCVDLRSREAKHNDGTGAKYTRSRRPVRIVYHEEFATLGAARSREADVKRWKKARKEELAKQGSKKTGEAPSLVGPGAGAALCRKGSA